MGISKLLSDKKFVLKIMVLDKAEEVQKAFKEQKVDLSIEECEALGAVIKEVAENKKTILRLDELENITGGTLHDFWDGLKCGCMLNPVSAPIFMHYDQHTKKPLMNKSGVVGGLVGGCVVVPGAIIGAWELAKFTKKKIGNWIANKKSTSEKNSTEPKIQA